MKMALEAPSNPYRTKTSYHKMLAARQSRLNCSKCQLHSLVRTPTPKKFVADLTKDHGNGLKSSEAKKSKCKRLKIPSHSMPDNDPLVVDISIGEKKNMKSTVELSDSQEAVLKDWNTAYLQPTDADDHTVKIVESDSPGCGSCRELRIFRTNTESGRESSSDSEEYDCYSLNLVIDNKIPRNGEVKDRARRTAPWPLYVAPSHLEGGGEGVFTKADLPKGLLFGPYEGCIVKGSNSCSSEYSWEVVSEEKILIDSTDESTSNWLRFVNCARNSEELDLYAFCYKGNIYYITLKVIKRNTELLVWYGNQFAESLGIERPLDKVLLTHPIQGVLNNHETKAHSVKLACEIANEYVISLSASQAEFSHILASVSLKPGVGDDVEIVRHPTDKIIPSRSYRCKTDFTFCVTCSRHFHGICRRHPMLLVLDTLVLRDGSVKNRALKTVPWPLYIRPSEVWKAGKGVFTDANLPKGLLFGPCEGHIVKKMDCSTGYSWEVKGQPDIEIDAQDISVSNWVRYLNCARHFTERNLIALQINNNIFYVTNQEIKKGSELMVWYGKEYAAILGISTTEFWKRPRGSEKAESSKQLTTVSKNMVISSQLLSNPCGMSDLPEGGNAVKESRSKKHRKRCHDDLFQGPHNQGIKYQNVGGSDGGSVIQDTNNAATSELRTSIPENSNCNLVGTQKGLSKRIAREFHSKRVVINKKKTDVKSSKKNLKEDSQGSAQRSCSDVTNLEGTSVVRCLNDDEFINSRQAKHSRDVFQCQRHSGSNLDFKRNCRSFSNTSIKGNIQNRNDLTRSQRQGFNLRIGTETRRIGDQRKYNDLLKMNCSNSSFVSLNTTADISVVSAGDEDESSEEVSVGVKCSFDVQNECSSRSKEECIWERKLNSLLSYVHAYDKKLQDMQKYYEKKLQEMQNNVQNMISHMINHRHHGHSCSEEQITSFSHKNGCCFPVLNTDKEKVYCRQKDNAKAIVNCRGSHSCGLVGSPFRHGSTVTERKRSNFCKENRLMNVDRDHKSRESSPRTGTCTSAFTNTSNDHNLHQNSRLCDGPLGSTKDQPHCNEKNCNISMSAKSTLKKGLEHSSSSDTKVINQQLSNAENDPEKKLASSRHQLPRKKSSESSPADEISVSTSKRSVSEATVSSSKVYEPQVKTACARPENRDGQENAVTVECISLRNSESVLKPEGFCARSFRYVRSTHSSATKENYTFDTS